MYNLKKTKKLRFIVLGALLLFVAAASLGIYFHKSPLPAPQNFMRLLQPTPAPTPTTQPTQQPVHTPKTSPTLQPESTPKFEQGAFVPTALYIGGSYICTLPSLEAVEQSVSYALSAIENKIVGSGIIESEVKTIIEYKPADTSDIDSTGEALIALLISESSPLEVVSTRKEVFTKRLAYTGSVEKDASLVVGTRIVVRYGTPGEERETRFSTYTNGVLTGETQVVVETVTAPVNGLILEGSQKYKPTAKPGKNEGKKAPKAGELDFSSPVKKPNVVLNYGQVNGVLHLGLDYSAAEGTEVLASESGEVVCIMERGSYGLMIEIDHGNGFTTRYAHLLSVNIPLGAIVQKGEAIALSGASGTVDSPHLHFEIRFEGIAYNPRFYL